LPDISTYVDPIYQTGQKYATWPQNVPKSIKLTKWQQIIPNGHKMYQHFPI
jgi:hypothetical protein